MDALANRVAGLEPTRLLKFRQYYSYPAIIIPVEDKDIALKGPTLGVGEGL